ncbi:MAG: hypothetical protein AAB393_14045 [Bacteroidota bacterium]
MSVTIKSTKRIRGAKTLPPLPAAPKPKPSDELKEIEDYIRSLGGKPLTKATRQKLIAAGCYYERL